jgi:small subunit ribosomal protein S35
LKQFCTPWPKGLETSEKMEHHFPIEVITSDYCHSAPTIRNPLSRIVTIRLKLACLKLDKHAFDKFQRLVGERYNPENDTFTLVTDRCPLRKQNYDYAMYLLTALLHESKIVEPWESTKVEADMEEYIWSRNQSKDTAEAVANWGNDKKDVAISASFGKSVENLINEGENDYNISKYKEEVLKLLGLPLDYVELKPTL